MNTIPAAQPPSGIVSNFENHKRASHAFTSGATFLLCLMTCFFLVRVYTNLFIIRKASWNDLTCAIGYLGALGTYIGCFWGAARGLFGKNQWDVKLVDTITNDTLLPSCIVPIISPLTFLFIKLTFFLFYYQIFRPIRWIRICTYIGATVTCAFYGAATIAQLVFTTSRPGETWAHHLFSDEELKARLLSVPLSAVGLAIDLVLLIMPIKAVAGLQLATKRKIGILSIFMFGILACIGSTLSIYYRVLGLHTVDQTWTIMPVELVTLLEMNIGIVCVSMPAVSKMFHHYLPQLSTVQLSLYSRLVKFRSARIGKSSGQSTMRRSDSQGLAIIPEYPGEPYANLQENPLTKSQTLARTAYELSPLKTVHTFVRKGADAKASEDNIHLTYGIEQQEAIV